MSHAAELALRPQGPDDREFVLGVYASTRVEELSSVPWNDEQKSDFVRMQFEAQDRDWRRNRPHARFEVIEVGGQPAGRLVVDDSEETLHIVDIAILPEFRGRGLGTRLLRRLIDEAGSRDVTIYVEDGNPAHSLYARLGFAPVERMGIHQLMRRPADPSTGPLGSDGRFPAT